MSRTIATHRAPSSPTCGGRMEATTHATMAAAAAAPRRFSTVLVARSNHERPSKLEMQLRHHCQKIRVSASLSGAHFVFPQEQGLAVRVYYGDNVDLTNHPLHPKQPSFASSAASTSAATTKRSRERFDTKPDDDSMEDVDGIRQFCRQFQRSVVFFVVKPDDLSLDNPNSMVHRAMRLVDPSPPPQKHPHISSHDSNANVHAKTPPTTTRPVRIVVVSSTEQVLVALTEWADAVRPHRCNLRRQFSAQARADCLFGASESASVTTTNKNKSAAAAAEDESARRRLSEHVGGALQAWADRARFPLGEIQVLQSVLGNLGNLVVAAAGAKNPSSSILETIPLDDRTKQEIHRFFSGRDGDEDNILEDDDANHINLVGTPNDSFHNHISHDGVYHEPPIADAEVFPSASFHSVDAAVSGGYAYNDTIHNSLRNESLLPIYHPDTMPHFPPDYHPDTMQHFPPDPLVYPVVHHNHHHVFQSHPHPANHNGAPGNMSYRPASYPTQPHEHRSIYPLHQQQHPFLSHLQYPNHYHQPVVQSLGELDASSLSSCHPPMMRHPQAPCRVATSGHLQNYPLPLRPNIYSHSGGPPSENDSRHHPPRQADHPYRGKLTSATTTRRELFLATTSNGPAAGKT